ncbi:MAG TPA: helix-turn-helix domain-containing protein [Marmoricola sp.]|nr:helix-turn-helix domain-containing protein [Marmoricola sp.]HNN48545.1 helix-turn-helix domain-containing protein [Marmoricola sp.]
MHTEDSILQGALELFAQQGVAQVSTDDIAAAAGVNRTTLYRRFGSKNDVVNAAAAYETARVVAEIEAQLPAIPTGIDPDFDAAGYLVEFFVSTHQVLRTNRLIQRLLSVDHPHTVLGLAVHAGPALDTATAILAERITAVRRATGRYPDPDTFPVQSIAATITRLHHSLLLTRVGAPTLDTRAQRVTYATSVIVPLILT